MAECFYCEKDNEKRKALMLDVCELPYSIVYLFRDQKNKGRCVVAFKGHKTEYFQLTPEENAGYFADVAKVAKVLDELYHPDKINLPPTAMACPMCMCTSCPSTRAA